MCYVNNKFRIAVYLRAPADVCYERIRKRNRKEETGVPFVSKILLLTTLTSSPNFCMIAAENAAPANNRH